MVLAQLLGELAPVRAIGRLQTERHTHERRQREVQLRQMRRNSYDVSIKVIRLIVHGAVAGTRRRYHARSERKHTARRYRHLVTVTSEIVVHYRPQKPRRERTRGRASRKQLSALFSSQRFEPMKPLAGRLRATGLQIVPGGKPRQPGGVLSCEKADAACG